VALLLWWHSYIHHQLHDKPRSEAMISNYLGPGYTPEEIEDALRRFHISWRRLEDAAATGAELIAAGKIVGWFRGRLEFGDRALGNRSILADPRDPQMKDRANATVKYRERFRPLAPSLLAEHLDQFFVEATPTPYMEKVFPIRPDKRSTIPRSDSCGRVGAIAHSDKAAECPVL
jgi:carbamoyltransferase